MLHKVGEAIEAHEEAERSNSIALKAVKATEAARTRAATLGIER